VDAGFECTREIAAARARLEPGPAGNRRHVSPPPGGRVRQRA
jgi:hypothetical protein